VQQIVFIRLIYSEPHTTALICNVFSIILFISVFEFYSYEKYLQRYKTNTKPTIF